MFAGKRPTNLGVADSRLAPPKKSPNCVSSQADPSDAEHYIAPLKFSGSPEAAIAMLRKVVEGAERTLVVKHEGAYLYAEYLSKLMGFVDDVEFYASAKDGVIHVRSASRLGRRDFGVNRERIESLRALHGRGRQARRRLRLSPVRRSPAGGRKPGCRRPPAPP